MHQEGGTYVTIASPDLSDFTIVIETLTGELMDVPIAWSRFWPTQLSSRPLTLHINHYINLQKKACMNFPAEGSPSAAEIH